jgi:hypothetical protein
LNGNNKEAKAEGGKEWLIPVAILVSTKPNQEGVKP